MNPMRKEQCAAALQLAVHRQLGGTVTAGEHFAAAISLAECIAAYRDLYPGDVIPHDQLRRELVDFINQSIKMSATFSVQEPDRRRRATRSSSRPGARRQSRNHERTLKMNDEPAWPVPTEGVKDRARLAYEYLADGRDRLLAAGFSNEDIAAGMTSLVADVVSAWRGEAFVASWFFGWATHTAPTTARIVNDQ